MRLKKENIYSFQDERKFVFGGLSLKNLGVLAGAGSVGKSFFILDFALKYVLNIEHFLTKVEKKDRKKVLLISNEDDEFEFSKRVILCLNRYFEKGNFDINNPKKEETDNILISIFNKLDIEIIEDANNIYEYLLNIKQNEYDLIIFDTFTSIFSIEDENSNSEVSKFIIKIKKILIEKNSAGLIIHHLNQASFGVKSTDDLNYSLIRGATALVNNCRYGAILHNFDNQEKTYYTEVKANAVKKQTYQLKYDIYTNGIHKIDNIILKRGREND
jgi:RecA-family ATPase